MIRCDGSCAWDGKLIDVAQAAENVPPLSIAGRFVGREHTKDGSAIKLPTEHKAHVLCRLRVGLYGLMSSPSTDGWHGLLVPAR